MSRRFGSRLVAALPFVVLLYAIGFSPWGLWEPDEGRYADIAQAMLDSGDFVTPRLNGEVYLDKPPLVYWVTAASLALWGSGETGARFGQAIFALGCLLLTWRLGILLFDDRRGRLAAIILASSVGFFGAAHLLTLDLALTFFVTLTLLCFLQGHRRGADGGGWFLAMWAAAAGAVLTKGPIGAVLPGMTIAGFLWLRGELRRPGDLGRLRVLRPLAGGLLFLAIASPWYVAVSLRHPDFPRYFFLHEHVLRFFSTVHRRPGPLYYYVPVALLGLVPWTLLAPASLWRQRATLLTRAALRSEAGALVAAWLLPAFLVFSLAHSKLPLYLMPLFPGAALAIAVCIDRDLRQRGLPELRRFWPAAALLGTGLGAALVWRRPVLATLVRHLPEAPGILAAASALVVGALAFGIVLSRRGRPVAGITGAACLWMLAMHLFVASVGRMNYFNETRYFASVLRSEERAQTQAVYLYDAYLRGLPFYLRGPVRLVDYNSAELAFGLHHEEQAHCLSSETRFLEAFRGPTRVFAVLRRSDLGRLLASIGQPLHLLALSRRHAMVSNQVGPGRTRQAEEALVVGGADLPDRLGVATGLLPPTTIAIVEIEREAGILQAALYSVRESDVVEVVLPIDPRGDPRIESNTPLLEESLSEDHLLRFVVPGDTIAAATRAILRSWVAVAAAPGS